MQQQREKWIYTTDIAVTAAYDTQRFILLIRRGQKPDDPFSGFLALPGGHVKTSDCGSANAAIRELKEETDIDVPVHLLEYFMVLDVPGRDPRKDHELTVSVVYRLNVLLGMLKFAKAQSDAAEIVVRELGTIKPEEMAFDHYKVIELLRAKGGRR